LNDNSEMTDTLNWCEAVLGSFEVAADHLVSHAGKQASACRLRMPSGYCYIKTHDDRSAWESEVHAYECWASAFGGRAPKLLAVHDESPLALVVTELPGEIAERAALSASQESELWMTAGRALSVFHDSAEGEWFGPCRLDGTPAETPIYDAKDYVLADMDHAVEKGLRAGCLRENERSVINAARELVPAFEGERPVPCHRDYIPANWIVSDARTWAGVIDFESAQWDVRVADFTRYPNWDWMDRPELVDALLEGYGRSFTPAEEQQRMVGHVQYAVGAIVWGSENAYYGFAEEGRQALMRVAKALV